MDRNYWTSGRIKLRAMEEKDLERYLEQRHSPDSVREWFEDVILFPQSETDVRESFKDALTKFNTDDKRMFVVETTDGEYIGEITVWYAHRVYGVFRYGIFLEESFRGKGYGKEALTIVMDYYFNELNYQKASPTVYSYNENSQKFHEKFGFVLEGRIRNDLYSRGTYHDMLWYGMLKNEFNEKYKHWRT